jgi:hypothetical protein
MQHPCYPLLGRAVDQFLAERPELRVFCVIDREDIVASGKYLICRHDHVERYAKRLEAAFRKHKFHRADFGSYHALLLTPNPKPIQY